MTVVRRQVGNTAENNAKTLPSGRVVMDNESHAVRFHDGVTPGGLVINTTKVELPNGPGPNTLMAGDSTAGFYGESAAVDFITTSSLMTAVGLSKGEILNDNPNWFKYAYKEKTLFFPTTYLVRGVSWYDLYNAGLVYGISGPGLYTSGTDVDQFTTVSFGGNTYIVRLMEAFGENPTNGGTVGDDRGHVPMDDYSSEWNELIYRTVANGPTVHWTEYTDANLDLDSGGIITWCQETYEANSERAATRGREGYDYVLFALKSSDYLDKVWRPVLELIN